MGNKLISGVNDLATLYPEIAAQWDWQKNQEDRPDRLLPGSGKKIWWGCENGHEWKTAVYHRTAGHGCKICESRKAALKQGINDLASRFPELAEEWDDEKNHVLKPSDVTVYSQAKVWWKCPHGHSWKTTVSHRFQGQGCPYCAGNRILSGFNDIVTLDVGFLKEWDYEKNKTIRPEEVGLGTERKCWWRCSEGHSWQASVYSRNAGTGCPYCAGNTVLPGVNDLLSSAPKLASEWDYVKNGAARPEMIARTARKPYWWICPKGHSYHSSPGSRSRGCGCIYCAGKKVLKGFNDFQSQHPELMPQWDWERNPGIRPDEIVCSYQKKVWWKDGLGHSWKATTANRVHGNGCPYCSGKSVLKGFNDLETKRPDLIQEWDIRKNFPLKPDMVSAGSNRSVWWICRLGHSFKSMVSARAGKNTGCPYCSNIRVLEGFNDFAHFHPELVPEWNKSKNGARNPADYTYGSRKVAWWTCPEGHDYKLSFAERHSGRGCPYCAGSKVLAGYNDLKTRTPWIAGSWDYERNHGLGPEDVFPYSNRKAWWICRQGHHWRASINARQKGAGCPICHGLMPGTTHFIS